MRNRERQRPRAVVWARGLTGRAPGRLRSVALYDGDTQPRTRQKEAFSPERSAGPYLWASPARGRPGRCWVVLGGVDAQRVLAAAGGACGGGRHPLTQGLPGTRGGGRNPLLGIPAPLPRSVYSVAASSAIISSSSACMSARLWPGAVSSVSCPWSVMIRSTSLRVYPHASSRVR